MGTASTDYDVQVVGYEMDENGKDHKVEKVTPVVNLHLISPKGTPMSISWNQGTDPQTPIRSIDSQGSYLDAEIERMTDSVANKKKSLADYQAMIGKPFKYEAELKKAKDRQTELENILNPPKNPPAAPPAEPAKYEVEPPDAREIRRRIPALEKVPEVDAVEAWTRARERWEEINDVGEGFATYNEFGDVPDHVIDQITSDPKWRALGTEIASIVREVRKELLGDAGPVSRAGLYFPTVNAGDKLDFGVNLPDPYRTNTYGVFINPLAVMEAITEYPREYPFTEPEDFADYLMTIIVHEVAHNFDRTHGEGHDVIMKGMRDATRTADGTWRFDAWVNRLTAVIRGGENGFGEFLRKGLGIYSEAKREARSQSEALRGSGNLEERLPAGPSYQRGIRPGNENAPPGGNESRPVVAGPSGVVNYSGVNDLPNAAVEPPIPGTGTGLSRELSAELHGSVAGLDVAAQAAKRFYEVNIERHAKEVAHSFAGALYEVGSFLAPRAYASKEAVNRMMKAKGFTAKEVQVLDEMTRGIRKMFDSMPVEALIDFFDRQKTGQKQLNAELQHISDFIQANEDKWYKTFTWEMVQDLKIGNKLKKDLYDWMMANLDHVAPLAYEEEAPKGPKEESYIKYLKQLTPYLENHFRVFWKVIPGKPSPERATIGQIIRGKRQFAGDKGFQKRHKLVDLSEGLELGGEPHTYNPMVMHLMSVANYAKFVAARRWLRASKKAGSIRFFPFGTHEFPDGFEAKIDDPIAQRFFPVEEGVVYAGEYRTNTNDARLINNYLGQGGGLFHKIGDGLRRVKNYTTAWELSFSLYHAMFESAALVGLQAGVGLSRILNLRPSMGTAAIDLKKGIVDLGTFPVAPFRYGRIGRKVIAYIRNKGEFVKIPGAEDLLKRYPDADRLIDLLFEGGGILRMHEDYRLQAAAGLRKAMQEHDYVSAVLHGVPAVLQTMMAPMFDYLIPAYKIGYFFELCSQQLVEKEDDIRKGITSEPEVARKAWDQVENYLGELNFDNLFWNRTFRVWMQMIFRSVTFYLGNIRALTAAGQGQAEEFSRMVQRVRVPVGSEAETDPLKFAANQRRYETKTEFRMPKVDSGVTAILGSLLSMAFFSSVYMLLKHGKLPASWKDMEAPPTGQLDERGKPVRLRWRNYIWIWHHDLFEHPLRTTENALSATVMNTKDALENRTFNNEYVYDPNEPHVKKLMDILAHIVGLPISFSVIRQAEAEGATRTEEVLGAFGVKRAPYDFDLEPDEAMALDLLSQHEKGKPATKEEAKVRQTVRRATKDFQNGTTIGSDEVRKLYREGLISPGSERSILRNAKKPWIFRLFLHLDAEEKLKVWSAASPAHKEILRPLMRVTRRDAIYNTRPKFEELREEMRRAVSGKPGPAAVPPPVPKGLLPEAAPVPTGG